MKTNKYEVALAMILVLQEKITLLKFARSMSAPANEKIERLELLQLEVLKHLS